MSKIKEIKNKQVEKDVINVLKDALELAENGEIVSIAMSFIRHDASSANVFTYKYPVHLCGDLFTLMADIRDKCIDSRLHKAGDEY